jgi:uncharacterized protein YukE
MSYEWDEELMRDIAKSMGDEGAMLKRRLEQLEKQIESNLGNWHGEDKEVYWDHKREWNRHASQLPIKLAAVQKAIHDVLEVLTAAKNNSIRTFSNH